jgi:hypothetical protein
VNYFARYKLKGEVGQPSSDVSYRQNRLAAAKEVLQKFFFVGLIEEMDRSVSALGKLMKQSGLEFPPGEVPIENTSFELRGDLGWIRMDDEVGSLLLASVREDQQLYKWAEGQLQCHGSSWNSR